MRCPWCDRDEGIRALHAHLAEAHPERVRVREQDGERFYGVACPVCGAEYEQRVKPRSRDPAFLEEFGVQIRLVAFDMLINHLLAEHEGLGGNGTESEG